ncbi:unnamed protein product [Schistosoma margrebowiei]|uniref:Uncharacterized protein n=1 Tax=Schistosoma margrebowiei TaxID=48269 RepID=A0A183M0S6_9TREM|nr:unnamed protein product [Schistosoma margrebowiei]
MTKIFRFLTDTVKITIYNELQSNTSSLTSFRNQATSAPKMTASLHSVSWTGIPILQDSHSSFFQESMRQADDPMSNRTTLG